MIGLVGLVVILSVLNVVLIILLIICFQKIAAARELTRGAVETLHYWQAKQPEREKAIRKDAIARSTSVVKGKVAEQLVPFAANFGFNPRDCRFIGSPIDLVVFEGLTEGLLQRIVFIEVKTGKSRLSRREREVRDAILHEEFTFLTCRVSEGGGLTWSS